MAQFVGFIAAATRTTLVTKTSLSVCPCRRRSEKGNFQLQSGEGRSSRSSSSRRGQRTEEKSTTQRPIYRARVEFDY